MGYPNYFSQLPDNNYAFSINKAGRPNYLSIKDFFHLMKVREDILEHEVLYTQYVVYDGKRPEQISYELYGDEQFYWIILQVNNITDFYNEWPLSRVEMNEFLLKKYGNWSVAGETHHWETVETFNSNDDLVFPGGMVVDENFEYFYWDDPETRNVEKKVLVSEVTNAEYEERLNDKKATIEVLDKKYIYDYEREVRNYFSSLTPQESSVNISDYLR